MTWVNRRPDTSAILAQQKEVILSRHETYIGQKFNRIPASMLRGLFARFGLPKNGEVITPL